MYSQWILLKSSSELKDLNQKLFTCFAKHEMKANVSKCDMLLSTTQAFNIEISKTVIRNSHL